MVAALRVRPTAAPDDVIVVLLPDGGRGYLSKIFNDAWMADYGFLREHAAGPTVADLLAARHPGLPALVHVHPDETVAQAIALLREYDVSQLPVVQEEPPLMAAEVAGSVAERDLLDALVSGRASPQDPVSEHMSPPLPVLGQGEPVSRGRGGPREGRRGARSPRGQARRRAHPGRPARLTTRRGRQSTAGPTMSLGRPW